MVKTCYSAVPWGYFNVGQLRTTKYSPNKSHCAPENEYLPGQCWKIMSQSSMNHGMGSQKHVKSLYMGETSTHLFSSCTTLGSHTRNNFQLTSVVSSLHREMNCQNFLVFIL